VFSRNDTEILQSFNYLAKRADALGIASPRPQTRLPMILIHIRSSPDGPLEPAHDAVAEVFCDVDRRHFIQIGITDFFGDLLGPSYAVAFAIDHELMSVGRALRQHGFIDTLNRNAGF
jgi:hypothetical protein